MPLRQVFCRWRMRVFLKLCFCRCHWTGVSAVRGYARRSICRMQRHHQAVFRSICISSETSLLLILIDSYAYPCIIAQLAGFVNSCVFASSAACRRHLPRKRGRDDGGAAPRRPHGFCADGAETLSETGAPPPQPFLHRQKNRREAALSPVVRYFTPCITASAMPLPNQVFLVRSSSA